MMMFYMHMFRLYSSPCISTRSMCHGTQSSVRGLLFGHRLPPHVLCTRLYRLCVIHMPCGGGRRGTTEILLQSSTGACAVTQNWGRLQVGYFPITWGTALGVSYMRNWKVIRNSLLTITERFYYNVWSTVIR